MLTFSPPAGDRREDLQRNVVLIRELNINIGKVVELYRELSVRCGGSLCAVASIRLLRRSPPRIRAALSARLVTRLNDKRLGALFCFVCDTLAAQRDLRCTRTRTTSSATHTTPTASPAPVPMRSASAL